MSSSCHSFSLFTSMNHTMLFCFSRCIFSYSTVKLHPYFHRVGLVSLRLTTHHCTTYTYAIHRLILNLTTFIQPVNLLPISIPDKKSPTTCRAFHLLKQTLLVSTISYSVDTLSMRFGKWTVLDY